MNAPRLLDAGDCALTVEFDTRIDAAVVDRVGAFDRAVAAACARGELPGVVETMPTFRSLTVLYDPLRTRRSALEPALQRLLDAPGAPQPAASRAWRLPACYGGTHGADLDDVAQAVGMTAGAVAELHAATTFTVFMIGFMPGFGFIGGLPSVLSVPRLREPRLRVPAGSVAITGPLTAVYPWESPGGWRLIGRCPARLFDAQATPPALLAPGDRVRFEAVSEARYVELDAAVRAGEIGFEHWREAAS
jgi:KipI family sensor histidine kinase inhibitor